MPRYIGATNSAQIMFQTLMLEIKVKDLCMLF